MSRIAYVNGRYLPMRSAMVHIEDRGYQFGDGVYEVCEVREGRLIDERRHLARLKRRGAARPRLPGAGSAAESGGDGAAALARQAALEQGARDAWFVDKDGAVTESASANAWIVTPAGAVVTRPADHGILRGITRTVLFDVVKAQGLVVEERPFTLEEARAAREAFVTAASQIVLPVVRIDGHAIGDGKPGPIATALRREFHRYAEWG